MNWGDEMDGVQTEVLQRITRVETKVDNMDEKLDRAIAANETAVEALSSAKSAHHRLDKIEDNQKWLWRTIAGAFILAIAAFIIAGGLK
ncbi:hemolysin XhlA [compost metagenome]